MSVSVQMQSHISRLHWLLVHFLLLIACLPLVDAAASLALMLLCCRLLQLRALLRIQALHEIVQRREFPDAGPFLLRCCMLLRVILVHRLRVVRHILVHRLRVICLVLPGLILFRLDRDIQIVNGNADLCSL